MNGRSLFEVLVAVAFSTGAVACREPKALDPMFPDPLVPTPTTEPKGLGTPHPTQGDAVVLGEDVRRRCKLVERADGPRFDYDSAALRPRGREILDALAECLKDGALSAESLTLVGRADPRGPEAYNDALGYARARAVSSYLELRGVDASQLETLSRGKRDAVGADEASWALDRRVDISVSGG